VCTSRRGPGRGVRESDVGQVHGPRGMPGVHLAKARAPDVCGTQRGCGGSAVPARRVRDATPARGCPRAGVGRRLHAVTSAPLTIRPAVAEDVDALLELVHAAYRGEGGQVGWTTEAELIDGPRTTRELLAADLADPGIHVLVAGDHDGCCAVTHRAGEEVASFGMFAVRPDQQGSGLGKALQAAAEEYFTRGWLLQAVGAYGRRPWLPIAVQAVVFAALHGWGTPWGFADLVVFGSVAGWLTVRTGGLEASIALHVVNNLLGGLISAAYGDLSVDETAADLPWQLALLDTGVLIAYAWLVLLFFDRQERTGKRSVEARPVAASMKSIGGAMRASTSAE